MPPTTATCYLHVLAELPGLIDAEPGDYLAIMPPPCPQNLWVHEPFGLRVVRRGRLEEGKLWSRLGELMESGALVMLHAPRRAALPRLLRAGEMSLPQALRALRSA